MGDTPERAAGKLDGLARDLDAAEGVADAFTAAILADARRRGSAHPTPQARMAASGLVVQGESVIAPPSATVVGRGGTASLGAIVGGAEYGSGIYPQFGPRRGSGAFFGPSIAAADADASTAVRAADTIVEQIVDRAV